MITINEIAKLANASRTTVSRVLNNNGYVSEEMRNRISKVIEETGYIPSEQAKSLRTKKTNVIGVILPKLSMDTSSRIVNTISDELAAHGYQIILANTNLDPKQEILNLKLLKSRQVDGIILFATNMNKQLHKEIKELKIPLIALGQNIPHIPVIINDDYQAAKDMTKLMMKKGHSKIAFIGVSEDDPAVGKMRKQGFLDALNEEGIHPCLEWIEEGNFEIKSGYNAMKRIMEATEETPTVVFAVTDMMAVGAIEYLTETGMLIHHDIAIAGMDNSILGKYLTPSLTTVNFSNEQMGSRAAHLVLDYVQQPNLSAQCIKMDYEIIERESL